MQIEDYSSNTHLKKNTEEAQSYTWFKSNLTYVHKKSFKGMYHSRYILAI